MQLQTLLMLSKQNLNLKDDSYEVQERLHMFADCSSKRGGEIAQLIIDTFEGHAIPLSDCRAQGYNNAGNMAGKYKGAQAKIEEQNSVAIISPCRCHTLNLCSCVYRKQSHILAQFKLYYNL